MLIYAMFIEFLFLLMAWNILCTETILYCRLCCANRCLVPSVLWHWNCQHLFEDCCHSWAPVSLFSHFC